MASTEHLAFSERGTSGGSILTLRQLSTNNGFVRVIKCIPGMITIIEDDDAGGGIKNLRDALLGKMSSSKVDIRFGDRGLHSSEIQVISSAEYVGKKINVRNVLNLAGAPERALNSLLRATALEKAAEA